MAKTYTQHKLTNAQCKRLNQLVNGNLRWHGMALVALVRKGLVTELFKPPFTPDNGYHWINGYELSDTGRAAYEQARREGW